MAGEQSLGDRAILHAGETSVDHPQHLRDTLAALLGYAVVGRDGATADGSPQAADRIEAVGCILIKDHHSHEASAVGRRQVCQVDVTILNREATVLVVYSGDGVGQHVVIGNRRAQRCRSWFEQDGAGVGDRGPEDRLVESRKCRVRSERITPNARRSCVLVRRSSALCEQVHSKIPGIRDFAAEIPRRDLKY